MGPIRIARKQRCAVLQLEQLEDRLVPASLQPTALEQLMLEQLNDARANPAAYGQSIGVDLSNVAASQPLAFDTRLIAAARGHSQDMNVNGYFNHIDSQGRSPGVRMASEGFTTNGWAESIAAGYTTTESALRGLIIDDGIPDLGHRRHLLAIDAVYKSQSEVGVGLALNGTGPYVNYYTIDSAAPRGGGQFLTGVVFNDTDGDGKYDVGEGLGGVTITVQGVGSTTSFGSGGYTIGVPTGTYSVLATGGGLNSTFTQTVTIGTTNQRLRIIQSAGGNNSHTPTPTPVQNTPPVENIVTAEQHAANVAAVQQLYVTLLRRSPSALELDQSTDQLDHKQLTREALATQLRAGSEFGTVCTIWLRQAYRDMLGRSISSGEIDPWVGYFRAGGSTEAAASAIVSSLERRNLQWAGWVRDVYQTYLRRTPGGAEISYWSGHFQAGWTKESLAAAVIGSGEYQNRVGLSNNAFVIGLYQDVLGRTPGNAEVAGWANALNSGLSRGAVIAGFLGSGEYRWKQNWSWSVLIYSNYLGRAADVAELNGLTSALNAGANANNVLVSVLCSLEYYNRAARN